jgi:hypothetical protein
MSFTLADGAGAIYFADLDDERERPWIGAYLDEPGSGCGLLLYEAADDRGYGVRALRTRSCSTGEWPALDIPGVDPYGARHERRGSGV